MYGCQNKAEFCADFGTIEGDVRNLLVSAGLGSAWSSAGFEYSYARKEQENFWGHCVHI